MEHISIAGRSEPVPVSGAASSLLDKKLDETRAARGDQATSTLETLVGERIAFLLEGGMPSVDLATMRGIVEHVELPSEDEEEPTGIGKAVKGFREKLAQRGGPAR